MVRAIALARTAVPALPLEMLRTGVVCGCALALIFAKAALPF